MPSCVEGATMMQYKLSAWYYKLLAWLLVLVCLGFGFFPL